MLDKLKTKYTDLSIQARASLWFVICSILQRGISFLTVPIFTRLMSTEQYGYYSNYLSWFSILLVFTSLSLYYGVFNNAMIKYEADRDRYVASMQGLTFAITAVVFIIYLLFQDFFNSLFKMPTSLVLLMFIELLLYPSMQFWTAYNRFYYRYKKIVAVTLCEYILNPTLGIILVLHFEDKALARILSIIIVESLIFGFITVFQFIKGKSFFYKPYWKYALSFNIPLLPHYLSGQILSQSDRVMIIHFCGYSDAALYSVAYSIGILLNIFVTSINGTYTPWFYQSVKAENYHNIKRVSSIIVVLMFVLVVLLMLFGPEILFVVASKDYSNAVYVIPPVAASLYFTFVYNLFANVEFYFEKKKYVMYSSVLAAALNIILNIIFIKLFGYIAAAYTTLFCYTVYAVLHYLFAADTAKQNNILIPLFDRRLLALLASGVYILVVVVSLLYRHNVVRWSFIAIIFTISFLLRNKIIKQFKMVYALKKEQS